MTTILEKPVTTPVLAAASRVRLDRVSAALWRVVDTRSGRVVGHLAAIASTTGTRYRAQRFQTSTGSFRPIGEFWSAAEAAETLRLSR